MIRRLREQLDAELSLTRTVLDAMADAPLRWRPHDKSYSLGRLAMHVATLPGWIPSFMRAEAYDMGAGGAGPDIPEQASDILEAHATAVARAHAALDAAQDSDLAATWTLLRDGRVIASMTRAEAISRYVVRHMVHHRGQLTVYMRLCDIAVPALYGDSADERLLPPGP